jgi:hypothetical protein
VKNKKEKFKLDMIFLFSVGMVIAGVLMIIAIILSDVNAGCIQ